ncbi:MULTISPECIES: YecA family protein [Lactococcus]|uniref:YecA family protein n=1 Tax=Lactococcus TaxID=1357 RepID=UPI0003468D50|nr:MULTISPECIES: SEC-C metal-binding domain-containing protein [Lactococcus]MCA2381436.1 SEC-C domain-containing protein [Lactococcus sp. SK2-659]MCI2189052.1 SEC-C domain-containing protein [Lactococcus lactis]
MTNNEFISCDICNEIFNLRIQMGNYNIPFNIVCPNCSTKIKGMYNLENDSSERLFLTNAHKVEEIGESFKGYCVELSAEFPTKKMFYRDLSSPGKMLEASGFTPFLRNLTFYPSHELATKSVQNSMRFADFFKEDWDFLYAYFNLFWNEKYDILFPKLEKLISKIETSPINKVNNKMDAAMSLHQILVTATGLGSVLPESSLTEYMEIAKVIGKDTQIPDSSILEYSNFLKNDFNNIEKNALDVVSSFSKIYNQLIPVVALKNSSVLDTIDKDEFGIMTTNFEELSSFYAQSYEWILDNIDIVIGLNNAVERGDSQLCFNKKSLDDLKLLSTKYNKLDYLKSEEAFSKPAENLKNRIRNAIQHFSREIDYSTQKITFIDSHRGKESTERIFLIDFASLCLENFYFVIYILELIYNLRKISYKSEGIILSEENVNVKSTQAILKNEPAKNKKIGRNKPCPCGSGLKYKKCHGKNRGMVND